MTFETLGDLNWFAVAVAAITYFGLGGLWYAPFAFGTIWMRAAGMAMPEGGEGPGAAIYISPLVGALVSTVATAMIATATGSTTFREGVVLGIVIAVGYAVTLLGVTATFDTGKPEKLTWFLITAGYHVVGLLSAAVIVSVWT